MQGGPSKIQYRKKPTDDEEMADIAVPGQEKERPAYETLSEMAEEYRYGPASTQVETDAFAARRRPFLGEEEEPEEERAEDDERARWGTNQYLRGRPNPRSAF